MDIKENNEFSFKKLSKKDLQNIINIAREIIEKYYVTFLDKKIVNEYINSKQFENEILENIENCTVMKMKNKIIGFSIIIGNKIHLIMIDSKYQKKNNGTKLLV